MPGLELRFPLLGTESTCRSPASMSLRSDSAWRPPLRDRSPSRDCPDPEPECRPWMPPRENRSCTVRAFRLHGATPGLGPFAEGEQFPALVVDSAHECRSPTSSATATRNRSSARRALGAVEQVPDDPPADLAALTSRRPPSAGALLSSVQAPVDLCSLVGDGDRAAPAGLSGRDDHVSCRVEAPLT